MAQQSPMTHRYHRIALWLGAFAFAHPAAAQDTGGLQTDFNLTTGINASDNPDFVEDDSGTSELRGTADLTFSVSSVTKQDQLRFDTGLQLETGQDNDIVTDPFLQLSYGREGANATFSAAANLRITDASSTFINTDSFDNQSLIVDTGERQAIGLQTALDWGAAAPFGGTISLSHDRSRFVDTSNPDLFDSETTGLENSLRFDINNQLSAYTDLTLQTRNTTGIGVDRDAVSLAFGVRATPNDVLSWDTELSYQTIDLSGGDPNNPTNETEEGVGLGFNATYLRPNGNIGLSVSSDIDGNGRRNAVSVSRSLTTKQANMTFSIGATQSEDLSEIEPVLGLDYTYQGRNAQLSANLSQSLTTNVDNDEALNTSASVNYTHTLSPRDQFLAGLTLARNDVIDENNQEQRLTLDLSYTRNITENIGLTGQYTYQQSDDTQNNKTTANSIFIGISTNFINNP